jgi:hypothetical protein
VKRKIIRNVNDRFWHKADAQKTAALQTSCTRLLVVADTCIIKGLEIIYGQYMRPYLCRLL